MRMQEVSRATSVANIEEPAPEVLLQKAYWDAATWDLALPDEAVAVVDALFAELRQSGVLTKSDWGIGAFLADLEALPLRGDAAPPLLLLRDNRDRRPAFLFYFCLAFAPSCSCHFGRGANYHHVTVALVRFTLVLRICLHVVSGT